MENVLNPPWKISMQKFQRNSIEIGVLMFSMEFHLKCPNPPCKYFACKSMEKFPWNFMEIDILTLYGIPWRISMEIHGIPWRFFTRVRPASNQGAPDDAPEFALALTT